MKFKTKVSRPSLERLTVEQFLGSGKRFVAGDKSNCGGDRCIMTVGADVATINANTFNYLNCLRHVISAKACDEEFTAMNLLNRWQARPAIECVGLHFDCVDFKDYANLIKELSMTEEERAEIEATKAPAMQEWKNGDICYHEEFDDELRFVGFACYDTTHAAIQCAGLLAGFHVVEIAKLTPSPSDEQLKTQFIKNLLHTHTPKQLAEVIYDMEQAK